MGIISLSDLKFFEIILPPKLLHSREYGFHLECEPSYVVEREELPIEDNYVPIFQI